MGCVMFVLWHTLLFFLLKKLLYTKLDRCCFEEVGHWMSDIGLLDSGHPKPGVLGLKNQDAFKKCIVFEEKKPMLCSFGIIVYFCVVQVSMAMRCTYYTLSGIKMCIF